MKEQLSDVLENSRNYTLAVAELMPADLYNSKPVDTVWNFGELLNHIAYGIEWWESNYIRKIETEWNPPAISSDKKAVIKYLEKSYKILQKTLESIEFNKENIKGFHATTDHITHHRGQAVLHLRVNGITPPEYIY